MLRMNVWAEPGAACCAAAIECDRRRIEGRAPATIRRSAEAVDDLGPGGAYYGAMLADIEARPDESEGLHLTAQTKKITVRNGGAAVAAKARIQQVEVHGKVVGGGVGGRLAVERRAQPPPDEGELAPVRFVRRPWREGPGIVLQLFLIASDRARQLVADSRQPRGLAEV